MSIDILEETAHLHNRLDECLLTKTIAAPRHWSQGTDLHRAIHLFKKHAELLLYFVCIRNDTVCYYGHKACWDLYYDDQVETMNFIWRIQGATPAATLQEKPYFGLGCFIFS